MKECFRGRSGLLLLILVLSSPALGGVPEAAKLSDSLAAALTTAKPDQLIPVTIRVRESAGPEEIRFAVQGKSGALRRAAVKDLLRPRAEAALAPLLTRLRAAARNGLAGSRLRSLWISPTVSAELTPGLVRQIASRPEVLSIGLASRLQLFDAPMSTASPSDNASGLLAAPECGVSLLRAPKVWTTYGTKGQGVVVALIDTGSCYTHPDIKKHIWVNPGEDLDHDGVVMDAGDENGLDDDGNGFVDDLIGWDFGGDDNDPQDTDGHGSHTAGIIVGDGTSGRQTGVAPGAKLMVIRIGMANWADDADAWSALQYAAENGADVASMSFGTYHADNPDRATWREVIDTVNAMGMITVNAAGNAGGSNPPDDVGTPPDVPGTIAVGAVDCSDTIASFSSQGPSSWSTVSPYFDFPYPPGYPKPEVSAPGVDNYSLDQCSGYLTMSGTSMSAPFVAGAAALVRSRKHDISQEEMKRILTTTAVDLGDPGWDRAYGYGRVDAFVAAGTIGGWVNFASYRVLDSAPGQGNGDTEVDPGELITLPVTLHNSRTEGSAQAVWAIVSSETPGITVHDNVAFFPDIPAGSSAESLPPHFTFTAGAPCGGFATFELETHYDNGRTSHSSFLVRLGTVQETTLFSDDFETDKGWTRSGTATAGFFVREDPHLSMTSGGVVSQPEDDHSPTGTKCWVTGNNPLAPYSEADDVDGGAEILLSPRLDLSGWTEGMVEFWYWAFLTGQGLMDFDLVSFSWSNDDGANWVGIETMPSPGKRFWNKSEFSLFPIPNTNQMRFKMEVTDNGRESVVDGLFDDFKITGRSVVCDAYSPPAAQAPHSVGATLQMVRSGANLRFDWQVPPVDATHDVASLFRLRSSSEPQGGFVEFGSATVPWHIEPGGAGLAPPILFFTVSAENNGGPETP